jgi:hypothetical protein
MIKVIKKKMKKNFIKFWKALKKNLGAIIITVFILKFLKEKVLNFIQNNNHIYNLFILYNQFIEKHIEPQIYGFFSVIIMIILFKSIFIPFKMLVVYILNYIKDIYNNYIGNKLINKVKPTSSKNIYFLIKIKKPYVGLEVKKIKNKKLKHEWSRKTQKIDELYRLYLNKNDNNLSELKKLVKGLSELHDLSNLINKYNKDKKKRLFIFILLILFLFTYLFAEF